MSTTKVFILSLRGATWGLIEPWIAQGDLPNLRRLVSSGICGPLHSPLPAASDLAWSSLITGSRPGKTTRALGRQLSEAGYTVGTMNLPAGSSSETINGFQIHAASPAHGIETFCPPELRAEIEKHLGHKIQPGPSASMRGQTHDGLLNAMETHDEQWASIGSYLLEAFPREVMIYAFDSLDLVQRYFWHYMDPMHFLHEPGGARKYRHAIKQVYCRLDAVLGKLMRRLPAECVTFVISPTGGRGLPDRTVFLNRYLAKLGLLTFKTGEGQATGTLRKRVANWLGFLPDEEETGMIDLAATRAYCREETGCPGVWINTPTSNRRGTVAPYEYEALLEQISGSLRALKDPWDGSPLIAHLHRREDLFDGELAGGMPDLVFNGAVSSAFSTGFSGAETGGQPVVTVSPRNSLSQLQPSGVRSSEGLWIGTGGKLMVDRKIAASAVTDFAPTLLHLLGVAIPAEMDGCVCEEMFEPAFLEMQPVRYTSRPPPENLPVPRETRGPREDLALTPANLFPEARAQWSA